MDSFDLSNRMYTSLLNSGLYYMAIFWLFHLLQLLNVTLNIDYTSDWSILA